jgi:glycerol uptake facilitator-like aquaporin
MSPRKSLPSSQLQTKVGIIHEQPLSPRVLFAEFLFTFMFVYLSVSNAGTAAGGSAATNAAVVAALAASGMPLSGAHINPAVTIALAATRRVSPIRAAAYIPLQLLASVLATYAAAASGVDVASTFAGLGAGANLAHAAAAEVFPIFFIVVVLFQTAVATEAEGGIGPRSSAAYIGLAVFACASSFRGIFNPARAFGPAVFLGSWTAHWVYLLPIPAAVVAAILCEHIFVAPSVGRRPTSWLAVGSERLAILSARVKALGVSALIGYGICNIVYYGFTFAFFLHVRLVNQACFLLPSNACFL